MSDMSKRRAEEVLELTGTYTKAQLRKAYAEQAMKYHPDKVQSSGMSQENANEIMSDVNKAFKYLNEFFKDDPDAVMTCSTDDAPDPTADTAYDSGVTRDYGYGTASDAGTGDYHDSGSTASTGSSYDGAYSGDYSAYDTGSYDTGATYAYSGAGAGYGSYDAYATPVDERYAARKHHTADIANVLTSNFVFRIATKRWIWGIVFFFLIEAFIANTMGGMSNIMPNNMIGSSAAIAKMFSIIATPLSGFFSFHLSKLVRPLAKMLMSLVAFPIAVVWNAIDR